MFILLLHQGQRAFPVIYLIQINEDITPLFFFPDTQLIRNILQQENHKQYNQARTNQPWTMTKSPVS